MDALLELLIRYWPEFFRPLCRLLLGLSCGLLLANLLEALRWTDYLAKLATPLARLAHFGPAAASAFALAFASPMAANGLLSEKHQAGAISECELMLANLFNGFPAWLSHLPTIFFLTWPVLGMAAIAYVGITFLAALARTAFTIALGSLFLPRTSVRIDPISNPEKSFGNRLLAAFKKAALRFKKRLPRLVILTAVVYAGMWLCQVYGFFQILENWLATHLTWLTILKPQAISIIVLQLLAEMGATLGAASAALQDGVLSPRDIVIAMLIGNVLSTPLRAIRHQLPAYAGLFKTSLAFKLVIANQSLRAASMILMIALYGLFSF